MKPYMVEIRTYGVVMAEDESHAHQVADSYKRDIFNDDWNPSIDVDGEVVSVEKMGHGWDGECIPYGGDGNTKLADLLVPNSTGRGAWHAWGATTKPAAATCNWPRWPLLRWRRLTDAQK